MNIDEVEKAIDEAIEAQDFERVKQLLDEREKLLKNMDIDPDLAERLLKKDKERVEKIKSMMNDLMKGAIKFKVYERSLKSLQKASDDMQKRSWGRG